MSRSRSRQMIFVFALLVSSGCRNLEVGSDTNILEGSFLNPGTFDVLFVATNGGNADLNIILTVNGWDKTMAIQTLQRDYGEYNTVDGRCVKERKLTDQLAYLGNDLTKFKGCVEDMINARYRELRNADPSLAEDPEGIKKTLKIRKKFEIDAVVEVQLSGIQKVLKELMATTIEGANWFDMWGLKDRLCKDFHGIRNYLIPEKQDQEFLCSFDQLVGGIVSIPSKERPRILRLKEDIKGKFSHLAECASSKLRYRGPQDTAMKNPQEECSGYVYQPSAQSFQREFYAALLLSEILGYANILKRKNSGGIFRNGGPYAALFKPILDNLRNWNGDFYKLNGEIGPTLENDRYSWKNRFSPIPIVVWDGVIKVRYDSGWGPSERNLSGKDSPNYAIFKGNTPHFVGVNRASGATFVLENDQSCADNMAADFICNIAFPNTSGYPGARSGNLDELDFGYVPWVIPPPAPNL